MLWLVTLTHKVAGLNGRGGPIRSAPKMGADASQQFLNAKGFSDVVVCSGVEGFHFRAFMFPHGKHQDRHGRVRAERSAHINPAEAGHHQVGDDQVGLPVLEGAKSFFGVVRRAHVVALRGERPAKHARDVRFVINNENSSLARRSSFPARQKFRYFQRKLTTSGRGVSFLAWNQHAHGWTAFPIRGDSCIGLSQRCWRVQTTIRSVLVCTPIPRQPEWCFWPWSFGRQRKPASSSRFSTSRCFALWRSTFSFCLLTIRFAFATALQWVEMLTFVACCLVVSRVAERARRQTRQAEQRRKDVERLYELSQELMLYEDADGLIRDMPRLIDRIFSLQGVMSFAYERDQFYSSTSRLPTSIEASRRAIAQGPNPTLPIPGDMTARPLMVGMRPIGAMAWKPAELSLEVSTAVCAQVSIVIARSLALEATARLEAAREGERLRTALIDSLTHELRTPLTSIRAAATTLLEAAEMNEEGRRDMAAIIDEEATRLDMLVGDAVEMAEIDAQVVKVKLAPHQPHALLDEAVEESRQALKKQRVTIVEGSRGARPARMVRFRNRQPVLAPPSWKMPRFTRRRAANVKLSSRRRNDRLEFIVEDDGPGIDAADLPLIFEKFYRGQRRISMAKGSGMGLAITRAILTTHGGGIEATHGSKGGARFRFWVPLVEKEPETTS